MRQSWLRFLASYLCLGVGEPDADPAPSDDPEPAPEADLAPEPDDAAPEPDEPTRDAAPSAFERRLAELERENRDLRSRPAPAPTPRSDPDFDREEAQLAEASKRGATGGAGANGAIVVHWVA